MPKEPPVVSVIVPSTCKPEVLAPCIDGLLNRTSYNDLDIVLVVNETQREIGERREYLEAVAVLPRVRVLYHEDRAFNFSWANNWAVGQAQGEIVCFLNDDTEVIASDWLSMMVGHILQEGVGAVGAMLYYSDGTIQHAGVVLGAGGIAAHSYRGEPGDTPGYHDRALVDQDVSCVTAACMLVRRELFLSLGGYDEALGVAFNDVDLCLRLRAAGWRIVWAPGAELYHRESVSIGPHDVGEREDEWEVAWSLMRSRWSEELAADPHYSPNLALDPLQLWEPAFPPRVLYPWRTGSSSFGVDAQAVLASAGSR
jgi:O-antigen biosynthesis protein